jgi:hypothetical protein
MRTISKKGYLMESDLEALRMHLERLLEMARPDDHLRLTRTIALVRQAEVLRAKRQALDGVAWRYAMGRSAARGEIGNTLDRVIRRLNLRDGLLN